MLYQISSGSRIGTTKGTDGIRFFCVQGLVLNFVFRVLRFDNAATLPKFGALADGVVGQPNFTSKAAALTAQGMAEPFAVLYVPSIGLWVSDTLYRRVVRSPFNIYVVLTVV